MSSPLQLDKTSVQQGETITGSVTFQNCNSLPLAVQRFIIGARPPGGTHTGGPFDDFTPDHGAITLPVGGTVTITASRAISGSDPPGDWYSFATYQDMSDAWHDGPDAAFTVEQGSSAPANPIAFTKDMPTALPVVGHRMRRRVQLRAVHRIPHVVDRVAVVDLPFDMRRKFRCPALGQIDRIAFGGEGIVVVVACEVGAV